MNWDELIQIIGDNTETPEQLKAIRDAALRRQGIEVLLLNFALKFNKCTSVGLSTSALLLPI